MATSWRIVLLVCALLALAGAWLLRKNTPPAAAVPRAQVLADLALFQRLHETADAGLYKYRSRAQIDSAYAAARARVTDRLTVPDVSACTTTPPCPTR